MLHISTVLIAESRPVSAFRGIVTAPARVVTLTPMDTHDIDEPEGLFIGTRLQELAKALGTNQRQLAIRLGIDPRHFNSLWNEKKAAGLPLIMRIARNSGRSIAWVCGEEAARPQIGTVDASGRVTMSNDTAIAEGFIHFVDGCGVFAAGERVLVDPTSAWTEGQWLLVRQRNGGEPWIAWTHNRGDMRLMQRIDGEVIGFSDERHEVVGIVVGSIAPPPGAPSAVR